jgi:hypothetical protein
MNLLRRQNTYLHLGWARPVHCPYDSLRTAELKGTGTPKSIAASSNGRSSSTYIHTRTAWKRRMSSPCMIQCSTRQNVELSLQLVPVCAVPICRRPRPVLQCRGKISRFSSLPLSFCLSFFLLPVPVECDLDLFGRTCSRLLPNTSFDSSPSSVYYVLTMSSFVCCLVLRLQLSADPPIRPSAYPNVPTFHVE